MTQAPVTPTCALVRSVVDPEALQGLWQAIPTHRLLTRLAATHLYLLLPGPQAETPLPPCSLPILHLGNGNAVDVGVGLPGVLSDREMPPAALRPLIALLVEIPDLCTLRVTWHDSRYGVVDVGSFWGCEWSRAWLQDVEHVVTLLKPVKTETLSKRDEMIARLAQHKYDLIQKGEVVKPVVKLGGVVTQSGEEVISEVRRGFQSSVSVQFDFFSPHVVPLLGRLRGVMVKTGSKYFVHGLREVTRALKRTPKVSVLVFARNFRRGNLSAVKKCVDAAVEGGVCITVGPTQRKMGEALGFGRSGVAILAIVAPIGDANPSCASGRMDSETQRMLDLLLFDEERNIHLSSRFLELLLATDE